MLKLLIITSFLALVFGAFSNNDVKRLIKLSPNQPAQYMGDDLILSLLKSHTHFFDVTEVGEETLQVRSSFESVEKAAFPTSMRFNGKVKELQNKISVSNLKRFLNKFTKFNNRYYESASGIEAAHWLANMAKTITKDYTGKVKVTRFKHYFDQRSVIVKIEGNHPRLKHEIIVFGAHLDSINLNNRMAGRAPGADDDGSGCANNFEVLRILLSNQFRPKRSIEFHFYAAEEAGLLGSQDIAKQYYEDRKNVIAMIQLDMVGYMAHKNQISLVQDYTDNGLNDFLKLVINKYVSYNSTAFLCGYACSDFASWNKLGFPAALAFEGEINSFMHTQYDTYDKVNFDHVQEFTKLAIGTIVELSEPYHNLCQA